ncbi:MAG: hypothetical protein CMB99_08285 [Flavobacteriaceae bacterium]|nr:hypothetical protein [Flavobacteriaceae bacterium]|tara:strand:- start:94088 stop:94912 length:825 start_codon:yes stop_codon:yes gene_type:complete
MKNQNPFIMKQPELGKRIFELRKSKGLTQEELVEKCNINVRTIQRIEAGEVSPRSYTVKAILEALGVATETIFSEDNSEGQTPISEEGIQRLNISWIAGIFFIILSVLGVLGELYFWDSLDISEELIFRVPFNVLYLVVVVLFLRGYKVLGEHFSKTTLVKAVKTYIVLEILISLYSIFTVFLETDLIQVEMLQGLPVIIVLGIAELILGIGIRSLRDDLGSFANIIGIAKIVNGCLLISVLFSFFGLILGIPILVLEIIFIHGITTNKKYSYS